jgi:hypothetical protein
MTRYRGESDIPAKQLDKGEAITCTIGLERWRCAGVVTIEELLWRVRTIVRDDGSEGEPFLIERQLMNRPHRVRNVRTRNSLRPGAIDESRVTETATNNEYDIQDRMARN